jgi:predicted secreted protein
MTVSGGIALYFIIWWITLFAMLPIGVRSQHEGGEIIEGTEPGAPIAPAMWRKVLWTTLAAFPVFGLAYAFIHYVD